MLQTLAQMNVDYFLNDPTGQKIAAGVGLAVALVIVILILRMMFKHKDVIRKLIVVAVLIALAAWGLGAVADMGMVGIFAVGTIGFAMLVAFALFMTHT